MKKPYKTVFFPILLLSIYSQLGYSASIKFLTDEFSQLQPRIELIKNHIQIQFPDTEISVQNNIPTQLSGKLDIIYISFGFKALKQALDNQQPITIATLLTQAEILKLTRMFSEQLSDTQLIMSQPPYQCQLDLFKKQALTTQAPQSLGILLKKETLALLPMLKSYAKKIDINITPWKLFPNESISSGFHHLMQKHSAILLIASPVINNAPELSAIVQEANILNRQIIASSEEHFSLGIKTGCFIKTEHLNRSIEDSIRGKLKTTTNPVEGGEESSSRFNIIIPTITEVDG